MHIGRQDGDELGAVHSPIGVSDSPNEEYIPLRRSTHGGEGSPIALFSASTRLAGPIGAKGWHSPEQHRTDRRTVHLDRDCISRRHAQLAAVELVTVRPRDETPPLRYRLQVEVKGLGWRPLRITCAARRGWGE
jgi:hypothetical protein